MAEQEACTELVDKASEEEQHQTTTGQIEGESLLLPLLQGLLEAPEPEQTFDSGTESGEDQRTGLISEVQNALDKLSASLRSDSTEITPERRSSLLHLVTKLQAGLTNSLQPKSERRSSSSSTGGRFQRRKNRQTRHTVGVSQEELADARRLIEQISLSDLTPSHSESRVQLLQKQNSESSVTSSNSSYRNIAGKKAVKNAVAKPFASSNSVSNTSSSVQTPTEPSEYLELLFNEDSNPKEVTFHEPLPVQKKASPNYAVKSSVGPAEKEEISSIKEETATNTALTKNSSSDSADSASIRSAYKAVQQAAARKKENSESTQIESETEEDDTSTVKAQEGLENTLQENPIYSQPLQSQDSSTSLSHEEKSSRFNTEWKKLKMKRANTIDIPKPLKFYEDEEESDSDLEDHVQRRRNTYYALRGPIRVGNPGNKNTMPVLQPKTESDKKFLAFINKTTENPTNKTSAWTNNNQVWGSKFGNIKGKFEKPAGNSARSFWKTADDAVTTKTIGQYGPKISKQSARNLQQMFEEKQKQSRTQAPTWEAESNVVTASLKVKTEPEKTYKIVPQNLPVNQFSHAPQSAFKPIPKKAASLPISTPTISPTDIVKSEIKAGNNESVFLYSPKPLNTSQNTSVVTSPVSAKPWAVNAAEHGSRVLSMAASKFENLAHQEPVIIKPRRSSKDVNKVYIPTTLQEQAIPTEKYSAPYLAKSAATKSSTVRKLSGQYDSNGVKEQKSQNHYTPQYKPQTYDARTNVTQKQYTPPVQNVQPQFLKQTSLDNNKIVKQFQQPQNYRIVYDRPNQNVQPSNYSIRYDQPQSQQFITTHNQQYVAPQPRQPENQQHYQAHSQQHHTQLNQQYQPQNHNYPYQQQNIYSPPHTPYTDPRSPSSVYSPSIKKTNQFFQHVPGTEHQQNRANYAQPAQQQKSQDFSQPDQDNQYVSTFQFKPQQQSQQKHAPPVVPPPKLQTQTSTESVHEHHAVSSKVMSGPVSQQAVTVRQKSPMNREGHDMAAALNLMNSLQKVNKFETKVASVSPTNATNAKPKNEVRSPSQSFSYKSKTDTTSSSVSPTLSQSFKHKSETGNNTSPNNSFKFNPSEKPRNTIQTNPFKHKDDAHKETRSYGVVKPMKQQKATPIFNNVTTKPRELLEVNCKGQTVLTGQFHIPVINVKSPESPRPPTHSQVLSKSDSWHQICLANQASNKPSPSSSPTKPVVRSKSSHSLGVPKLFEAGMSKTEMAEKRKTLEAYLTGQKSPKSNTESSVGAKVVKRSINRIKTSEKVSASRQMSGGLSRSRTLPDIVCPEMLDESNVDKAFDDLFKSA